MKKKNLILLLLLLMISSVMRAYNVGDVIKIDNIAYKITKLSTSVSGVITPGTVEVTPGTTKTGAIVIPAQVTDNYGTEYKVTSVGIRAFEKVAGITSVTLPEGIISLANSAFGSCPDLVSFNIPASTTSVGINLLSESPKVTTITVAAGNANYADIDGVLCNKAKTTLIVYPQGRPATSYTVPSSITTLGTTAFGACGYLTSIDLGSVTTMTGIVFNSCPNLASLTFPATMTSIPTTEGFYTKCNNLASFEVASGNPNYSAQDGILFNKNKTELIACPQGKTMTSGYTIPSTVTKISTRAFQYSKLTNVTIPSNVKTIGANAFEAAKLRTVTIAEGVTTIEKRAFAGTLLTTVTVPASVTTADENIFLYCTQLTNITVATSNTNYTSVDGVMFTKDKKMLYAFPCAKDLLTEYTIPSSVEIIGMYAFCGVQNTVVQHIPTTVKELYGGAFEGSLYNKIIFDDPSGVTKLHGSAFREMPNLTELTIPASVKHIGWELAYKCPKLTKVTFAAGSQLETMTGGAFRGCAALTTVNIEGNSPIKLPVGGINLVHT